LGHNLVVGDGLAGFIVVDHLLLLIDFLSKILLCEALGLPPLLDQLGNVQGNMFVVQLLRLSVKLGHVLVGRQLLVTASS
ncbi:hypothetical protein EGW08_008905, partial [Elysia chlorotica]